MNLSHIVSSITENKIGEMKFVSLSLIREGADAQILRPVEEDSEKFRNLVESIRKDGILNPICLRELKNPANPDQPLYGLVDGRHRFTGARTVGLETIPAYVRNIAEADVLEAQVIANVQRVETKPMDFTNALLTIIQQNPFLTKQELLSRINQSETWLAERLQLVNIVDEKIANLINEGSIKLLNAYALSKLPQERQAEYVDMAISMTTVEFAPRVHAVLNEIKKAKLEGRAPKTEDYIPAPYLQKTADIQNEIAKPDKITALLAHQNINHPREAAIMALKWAIHLDPLSIAADTEDFKVKKEISKKKAEERKVEREALKKANEAKKLQSVHAL